MTGTNLPDDAARRALRELAAADASGLLERARARALARAERVIEDLLVEDLLAAATAPVASAPPGPPEPDPRPTLPSTSEPRHGHHLWWTYCILREADAIGVIDGLEGLEPGTRVEAVCDGGLAALVSPVPAAEYGDQRLREHLEDLAWVEHTARRHEALLDVALREATIVPLRLCTLYLDHEGVRRLLGEHRDALMEGLRRVDGCVEWGVKVFGEPRASHRQSVPEVGGSESRGAAYLLHRQHERALAERASEVHARCVEVVHQRISTLSRSARSNPPQRPEVHGRQLTMLLNGAYLVERGRTEEIRAAARALEEEWGPLGFTIELTGPWPPYNFVSGAAGVMS
jgi:hypothetical protein